MAIFIYSTADYINKKTYDKILSKYSPIYYGIQDKNKNFLEGNILNFKAALPSYIKENGIIDYAEEYEKNIEDIYNKVRKIFFDKYCYFLSRTNGDYLGGIYDFLYYFRIHIKAAVRFLDENNIKFIFMATPSAGFDNIIYEVSKILGIEYIGLTQIHNNRFFWTRNWQDFGTFSTSLPIFPIQNINVTQKIYDPFFMIRVQNLNKNSKNNLLKKYLLFLKDIITPFYYSLSLIRLLIGFYLRNKIYKPTKWLLFGNRSRFFSYKFIRLSSRKLRLKLEKQFSFENAVNPKFCFI